jgi:hypothetical protein
MPCRAVPTPVNPDGLLHKPGDVDVRELRHHPTRWSDGKRLNLDDLGWARSASTQTFLAGSIPGYYAETKAVSENERKLGAIQ